MANIYNSSAPNGWLVNSDTKKFMKVSAAEYKKAKDAATETSSPSQQDGVLRYYKKGGQTYNADTGEKLRSQDIWYVKNKQEVDAPQDASAINALYQKYFGRDAESKEMDWWKTQPLADLEGELLTFYKTTAKLDAYDGSPIKEGSQKTVNQLGEDSSDFSDKQKEELEAAKKRIDDGVGSPTDKENVDYAVSKGWTSTGKGASESKAEDKKAEEAKIDPADAKWVNDLYQKYFDRTATSDELKEWAKGTPAALEQFLGKEAGPDNYNYTSKFFQEGKKKRYDDAIAIIDNSNLPDSIKDMWRRVVSQYPDSTDFKVEQIIEEFNKIKSETIDPYYKQLADVAINDLKTNINILDTQRTGELEAERAVAGQDIRQAKEGLEKSGMTFTGKGIEELGGQSAYSQQTLEGGVMPAQQGFAGMDNVFFEGNVNQKNRLMSTSSAARYAANQQQLGSQAEKFLGGAAVQAAVPGLNYSPGGTSDVSAENVQNKVGKEASTLQGIIQNWEESQKVYKNK